MSTLAIRYYSGDPKPWHVSGVGQTMNFYCRVNNLQMARHIACKVKNDWYPHAEIVEEITPQHLKNARIGRRQTDH